MLTLPSSVKIYLCTDPTDMRKGHDGLSALVQHQLELDVFSGHLFVFVSRRGNRIKILFWDNGGFVLLYKRLEKGRFRLPRMSEAQGTIGLEASQLALLLDGIDYSRVKLPPRWSPPRPGHFSPASGAGAAARPKT